MTNLKNLIKERLENAKGITWDKCHKIYVLMDKEQVKEMRSYGYEVVTPTYEGEQVTPEEMFEMVINWYRRSCELRFIYAVSTNHENADLGFETLVEQDQRFYP